MSSSEFTEWQAYYDIEPFGEERADLRAGTIASPLVNLWQGKGAKRSKPSDWLMEFGEQEPQSPEDIAFVLQAVVSSYKARERRTAKQGRPRRGRAGVPQDAPGSTTPDGRGSTQPSQQDAPGANVASNSPSPADPGRCGKE
jgi:hypothetical protein